MASGAKWESLIGYSRLTKVGPHIFVSGTAPSVEARSADAYEQTKSVLRMIERSLSQVGAAFGDVVRTRMFVTNIARDWGSIGKAHAEVFGMVRPVTSMVEVRRLIEDWMLVEIEVDAITAG